MNAMKYEMSVMINEGGGCRSFRPHLRLPQGLGREIEGKKIFFLGRGGGGKINKFINIV